MKKIFFYLIFLGINFCFAQNFSDIRNLLSSEGKIFYGEEPNSILVIDYPQNLKLIENYLQTIDIPPQQVFIEARVVEVRLTGENALGINWSLFAEKEGLEIGQFKISGSTINSAISQSIPYKNTYYQPITGTTSETPFTITIFDDNLNIVLKALSNNYDTDILSAPRVTTINNRQAEINITQKLPWAEPEVSELEGGGVTVTWKVNFEEVGIKLKVIPTINEDGKITMELEPEVSEKTSDYELNVTQGSTSIPYTIPIVDKRYAKTKVVIGSGQTLIIGGLIKNRITKGQTKVPLLGDIPGLGWLFKSKKETKEKTELLIFVSPTIVTSEVIAKMKQEEEFGIGKWYFKERKEKEEKIKKEKEEKNKLLSQLIYLEKEASDLSEKRKNLEQHLNLQ